jgi:hypothetical protein
MQGNCFFLPTYLLKVSNMSVAFCYILRIQPKLTFYETHFLVYAGANVARANDGAKAIPRL